MVGSPEKFRSGATKSVTTRSLDRREILVSGLREFLAGIQVSVPVTVLAKWKTTVQMVALGALVWTDGGTAFGLPVLEIGLTLLWIAAILTLYTGYDYLRAGLKHMV